MYTIDAHPGDYLAIGRAGEHKARRVRFDLTPWVDLYGQGVAQLLYRRPGDTTPYPVALERDGDTVIWVITSTDTAQAGRTGRAELRYYVDDTLAKSAISLVAVAPTIAVPLEVPDPPGQSWLDQAIEAGNKVEAAAEGAGKQPKLSDHNTWLVWDAESGAWVDTGVSTGVMPNLQIGEVETLEPDEEATATITGTQEEPLLNLGIPKGKGSYDLDDVQALEILMQTGIVDPAADDTGALYTDETGAIYTL